MAESNEKRSSTAEKEEIADNATSAMETTQTETPTTAPATTAQPKPRRELFIRSLAPSITTEKLAEYFSQNYIVKHAIVVNDSQTKQSKGYGFVTFADVEDAQGALEELNGTKLDGKKIKIEYAEPRHREVDEEAGKSVPTSTTLAVKQKVQEEKEARKAAAQPPKLIVRNLPWSVKETQDLAGLFRSYGKIKQAILPKRGNKLAGFGFVVLRGKKNAERALQEVNGKEIEGRTLAVDWAVDKGTWENLQKSMAQEEEQQDGDKEDADVDMGDASDEKPEDDEDMEDMEEDEDEGEDEDEEAEEDEDEDDEEEEEEEEDERNASTIFIRNLPFTCTDEILYDHFSQFGRLRYARVVMDYETERPRGTAFVCFRNIEDAISCVRDAPKDANPANKEKDKAKKGPQKHSVLQSETADPTGRYTLDGRVLQVTRAVSRKEAAKLEEEGASRRMDRDTDKRRLFLLSEGTIPANSPVYKHLSPTEIKMREDSLKQRQTFIKKNPTLHLSLTRLSVRNIPRHVTTKDLKSLAREAVVGFAKDVSSGLRQPLSKEELQRSAENTDEAEKDRKKKGKGIVKQAKIVFETRDGSKVSEESGGRSRGYGFVEYYSHRHALMGLRWLNGHAVKAPVKSAEGETEKTQRLIVEFAIENAQVIKRRLEHQARVQSHNKNKQNKDKDSKDSKGEDASATQTSTSEKGKKRKRSEGDNGKKDNDSGDAEEDNKVAKRNRIIAKKRMQRKGRKTKG